MEPEATPKEAPQRGLPDNHAIRASLCQAIHTLEENGYLVAAAYIAQAIDAIDRHEY